MKMNNSHLAVMLKQRDKLKADLKKPQAALESHSAAVKARDCQADTQPEETLATLSHQ